MVTSSLTIAEAHSWFLRKYNAHWAARFLEFVRELPELAIESFDRTALTEACSVAARFEDQKLTLADAHGLAIMKELGVKSCWSTDRHLGLTGVQLATRDFVN